MKFILALDQGTTSSRAIVFDQSGSIVSVAQKEFPQIFPTPGWVEHNPRDIWSSQAGVAAEALTKANVRPSEISGIGITNQRETTVVWDRATGEPICNAIVWQDRRTAAMCDRLRARKLDRVIRRKTGLIVDAYFSATKVQWILENVTDAKARAKAGQLAFGTVDSWLVWNLTGGKVHVTDASNASRTMLFDIATGDWDDGVLMNTGTKRIASKNNLLTTVAWRIGDHTEYALEGSIFIAGAVVQWLRDGLEFFRAAPDIEALAATVTDTGGVYLVPAFAGLGAPHWDQYARGTLVGLTRGTTAAHVARAALEGIAFQVADVLRAMEADAKIKLKELRVDGGASANNLLMQFQSHLLGVPVVRPKVTETTALGAAYLAGLAVGYWKDQKQIAAQWQVDRRFTHAMKPGQRKQLEAGWRK